MVHLLNLLIQLRTHVTFIVLNRFGKTIDRVVSYSRPFVKRKFIVYLTKADRIDIVVKYVSHRCNIFSSKQHV